ncbi:MAG: substrate-binding domain-containing protein [Eubacteriales bacterium]|nr:substrate-binding domain-containing protein [Eubacteriales bacterium]
MVVSRTIYKWIALYIGLTVSLGLLSGCQFDNKDTGETLPVASVNKPQIGFAMDTLVIERWESDRNIFVSTVGDLGGEVIVQNANSDSDEQENQIRYLIKKNVDVLVIVAIDEAKLVDEIQLAQEHNIKVIAYDRMIQSPLIDLYVSFDSTAVGQMMTEALITSKPQGNYVIMNGSEADNNSALIREGIQSVLNRHPEVKIIAEKTADNWSADDAFTKFRTILEEQNPIDGILCSNDALAGAAVRALGLYRLAGQVAVTGQDADLDACQRIVEGTQLMTVYKPIAILAKSAAEAAIALAQGDTPQANDSIQVEGTSIPYERIAPVAVQQNNIIEAIINSGFHNFKDVYRNVPQNQWPDTTTIDN